jgi:cell division protein FtsB
VRGILWIPAIVGIAVASAAIDGDSGIRNWLALRSDLDEARTRIAELRDEVSELRSQADALEADEFAIERAIREELEYAREGETVVRLRARGATTPRNP